MAFRRACMARTILVSSLAENELVREVKLAIAA
jgi:hypothetical protein